MLNYKQTSLGQMYYYLKRKKQKGQREYNLKRFVEGGTREVD